MVVITGAALIIALLPVAHSLAESWTINAEEWARPRAGQTLVQIQPLVAAVQALNTDPLSLMVVHYPGGEEGALWANELRDWLVSLGIPSSRIEIQPGQSTHENITLVLKKVKENKE